MNKAIIIYRSNDPYELPVHVSDTIEEAAAFIGCSVRTLYNTKYIHGVMSAKGYTIELVDMEEDEQ